MMLENNDSTLPSFFKFFFVFIRSPSRSVIHQPSFRLRVQLETGNTLPKQLGLPFTDLNLSLRRIVHDQQKTALEIRPDFFHATQVDENGSPRAEEIRCGQSGLQIR